MIRILTEIALGGVVGCLGNPDTERAIRFYKGEKVGLGEFCDGSHVHRERETGEGPDTI